MESLVDSRQLTCREIGEFLRQARVNAGMSQSQAGRIINRDHSRICRLEKGQTPPDFVEFNLLVNAYGLVKPVKSSQGANGGIAIATFSISFPLWAPVEMTTQTVGKI